jgi:hypothetical protein
MNFSRLGQWCHDRRWIVVMAWIGALVFGNAVANTVGDAYRQDFSLAGFESTEGFELVESAYADGSGSGQSGQIVFQARQGVGDPEVRRQMEAMFAAATKIDEVVSVQSPYAPGGEYQVSARGGAAGRIAFATVNLPEDIDFTRASDIGKELRQLAPDIDGLRVELGGFLFAEFEPPSAELFGLAFAIVILIVAFGSVLAMGLPVGVALFGIAGDGCGEAGHTCRELGKHARELAAERAEFGSKPLLWCVVHVVTQGLGERLERRAEFFVAPSPQHCGSLVVGVAHDLGDESGLADSGFTRHEHRAPLTFPRLLPCPEQRLECVAPSGERKGGCDVDERGQRQSGRRPGDLPADLAYADGGDEPFEFARADRLQLEHGARSRERTHEFADKDLPTDSFGTQTRGLDHRCSEPVAVLATRVARTDTHSHVESATVETAVATLHCALHRDRARHRVGRAAVGDHDRVADGLHLRATGRGDGLAEIGEVDPAQFVGRGVARLGREVGRAHKVGEENADNTRRHHDLPRVSSDPVSLTQVATGSP